MTSLDEQALLLKYSPLFIIPTDAGKLAEKQAILLTIMNKKPVSVVSSGHMEATSTGKVLKADNRREVITLLENLQLCYELSEDESAIDAIVSKDKDSIKAYLQAAEMNDHIKVGLLLGYPLTAVEAFVQNECLSFDEIEKIHSHAGLEGLLIGFALSKKHYNEELKVLKEWYEVVKEYDLLGK